MSRKIGTHRTLPLSNAIPLSREFEREMRTAPALFEMVMARLERPRIPRWLVMRPVGVPKVSIGETGNDIIMNRMTAVASGRWDAVYIGRRNRVRAHAR